MKLFCCFSKRFFSRKEKDKKSENKVGEKNNTSCFSVLIALFRKRKGLNNIQPEICTCLCHTEKAKKNGTIIRNDISDNKFFYCKCSHACLGNNKLKSQKRRRKPKMKKQITKADIEHTGCLISPTIQPCAKPVINSDESPARDSDVGFHFTRNDTCETASSNRSDESKCSFEWEVNFDEVTLGNVESLSQWGSIYRGRWHGDVMVYTRKKLTNDEVKDFQKEVSMLDNIRHNNFVLFMGACTVPPNLAIITSARKGDTLYTHLHVRRSVFNYPSKRSIAKQVAQGMSYLHSLGITLGKLCSRNIYIESIVKIGIADYPIADALAVKNDYCCIPKGQLTYYAPELIKSLRKDGTFLTCAVEPTQKCDVYAYGTVLYELFVGSFPYAGEPIECVIWSISKGRSQSLDDKESLPMNFKVFIQSCWDIMPEKRPEFKELLASIRSIKIPKALRRNFSDSAAIRIP